MYYFAQPSFIFGVTASPRGIWDLSELQRSNVWLPIHSVSVAPNSLLDECLRYNEQKQIGTKDSTKTDGVEPK